MYLCWVIVFHNGHCNLKHLRDKVGKLAATPRKKKKGKEKEIKREAEKVGGGERDCDVK